MKFSIFEKNSIDETEVVINCKSRNPEIDKLAKHILQYDESISCRRDGRNYNIFILRLWITCVLRQLRRRPMN